MPSQKDPSDRPKLKFSRAWSAPGKQFSPKQVIAQVLSEPTFEDILTCAVNYGLGEVKTVHRTMLHNFELSAGAASIVRRCLTNIEIGYLRANGIGKNFIPD